MHISVNPILEITSFPFYIGVIPESEDISFPKTLPLKIGIHPYMAIPCQILSEYNKSVLKRAYGRGSLLSTPIGIGQLGQDRLNETIGKLIFAMGNDISGKKFLEVGCGSGEILRKLREMGAIVKGIEIGPHGKMAAKKYNLDISFEELRFDVIKEKFDCIFSYGCLEHISDLVKFFEISRTLLSKGGLFFHAVPNSSIYFNNGSLCLLAHEHVNYFTPANGRRLFDAQGFNNVEACLSDAGNEIFLFGRYDPSRKIYFPGKDEEVLYEEERLVKNYNKRIREGLNNFRDYVNMIFQRGQSLGLYAGGFDYIFMSGVDIEPRYFDGDEFKFGKRWLKNTSPIEPPKNILRQPVDKLIVCRSHYFEPIKECLTEDLKIPASIVILNIDDIISGLWRPTD